MSLNKCKNCGCEDSFLTSPAPCPTPTGCADPLTCIETIDAACVIYSGDPIMCGNEVVVPSNVTMAEALVAIANFYC
jgi:hypothetical protein